MQKTYNIKNPMAPLWFMYPHITRYCIGWRMGYGEDYKYKFGDWYSSLTIEEQKQYQIMFPEPKGWLGWYEEEYTDLDIYEEIYDDCYLLWNEDGKMKYSINSLQEEFAKGKKDKCLFFWGHQLSADGSITKSCLSQWWKSDFCDGIDNYCCMEQYMMAEKARLFKDDEILEQILKSNNPKQIKELGRKIKNFNEDVWKRIRYSIILNGNFAKFLQNEELMEFLLQTKNKVLVEASPYDRIWGIGMSVDNKNINNPLLWKGQNLLGFALMEVRDELIRTCQNYKKLKLQELHEKFG